MNLKLCKFPRVQRLASDWFKDNQLLSQLTHAHNRDTVPLSQAPALMAPPLVGLRLILTTARNESR